MLEINEIKELIYNAAVDGHIKPLWLVKQWLENLQALDEEILTFVYNEGWNSGMDCNDTNPSEWEE